MDPTKRKQLIILSVVTVIVFVALVGVGITVQSNKYKPPKVTETTDPITGEKTVTVEGKFPEQQGIQGPAILGQANIQPLFGDDFAYQIFRDQLLRVQYANASAVKIAKSSIKKSVDTVNGDTKISVDFDFYLNEDTRSAYHCHATYDQQAIMMYATFTDPKGVVTKKEAVVGGSD